VRLDAPSGAVVPDDLTASLLCRAEGGPLLIGQRVKVVWPGGGGGGPPRNTTVRITPARRIHPLFRLV
jgi:hypothetical protein